MASDSDWKWTPLKQKAGQFQLDDQADDDYWGIFEPLEQKCKADEAIVYTYQILPPLEEDADSNAGAAGLGGDLSDVDENEVEDQDDDRPDDSENGPAVEPQAVEPPGGDISDQDDDDEDQDDDRPDDSENGPAVEPQAVESQAVEPQAAEPQAVEPQAVEPQAVEPQAVEPQAVESQAVEPQAVEEANENYAILSQSVVFKLIERGELQLTPSGGPSPEPPRSLLALEFPTCNPDLARKLLNSAAHKNASFSGASSILPNNGEAGSFFGVRVHGRAAAGAGLMSSVLLVSLPLLGVAGELEKAWFLVFSNVAVATFLVGPADNPSVYPGQTRDGAFVFLVNCISAVLGRNSGSQEVEQQIQKCSENLRSILQYLASDDVVPKSELLKLESYLYGLLTIADCLRLQLKVLRRLHSLLQSAVHTAAAKATGRRSSITPPSSLRTSITIPCISDQHEQMPDVLMALEYLVDQRVGFLNDIQETEGRLRPSYELLLRLNAGRKRDVNLGVLVGSGNRSLASPQGSLASPQVSLASPHVSQASLHGSQASQHGSQASLHGPQASPHGAHVSSQSLGGAATTQAPLILGNTGPLGQPPAPTAPPHASKASSFTNSSAIEISLQALVQSGTNTASRLAFIREELSYQGELFSFFTVITTIFLPLSFFSSYFALDAFVPRIHSESDFWVITGIATGLFSAMITLMIGAKRYRFWSLGMFVLSLLLCPVCKVFEPQPKKKEDQEIREEVQVDFEKVVTADGTTTAGKLVCAQNTEDPLQKTLVPNVVGRWFLKRLSPGKPDPNYAHSNV